MSIGVAVGDYAEYIINEPPIPSGPAIFFIRSFVWLAVLEDDLGEGLFNYYIEERDGSGAIVTGEIIDTSIGWADDQDNIGALSLNPFNFKDIQYITSTDGGMSFDIQIYTFEPTGEDDHWEYLYNVVAYRGGLFHIYMVHFDDSAFTAIPEDTGHYTSSDGVTWEYAGSGPAIIGSLVLWPNGGLVGFTSEHTYYLIGDQEFPTTYSFYVDEFVSGLEVQTLQYSGTVTGGVWRYITGDLSGFLSYNNLAWDITASELEDLITDDVGPGVVTVTGDLTSGMTITFLWAGFYNTPKTNPLFHTPVRATSTGTPITLSGEQTIDSVALVDGDRFLARHQTPPSDNGVYVVSTGAWTRATDFDESSEFHNDAVEVLEGPLFGGLKYNSVAPDDFELGVSASNWSTAPGELTGGGNITVTVDSSGFTGVKHYAFGEIGSPDAIYTAFNADVALLSFNAYSDGLPSPFLHKFENGEFVGDVSIGFVDIFDSVFELNSYDGITWVGVWLDDEPDFTWNIIRSGDGGATWDVVGPTATEDILSIAFDPITPTTWYVTIRDSNPATIYRSTDDGETWEDTEWGGVYLPDYKAQLVPIGGKTK